MAEKSTPMRAALTAGIARVFSNIRLGLTNDLAREDAIALFRVANCILPAAPVRIALVCQECGKTWRVSPNAVDPRCPKCGGVDWEARDA